MKKILLAVCTLAAWMSCLAHAAPKPRPALGINLAGPADWNTELPFVDVFRMSRQWISQRQDASWGKGPKLELDEKGWVKRIEADCWAETPLCTISGGHYPSGLYTIFYDGEGELAFGGAAKEVSSEPGKVTADVDATKGGFWLRIMKTNPADYVRNIRVVMPGFAESYMTNPWHPAFLKRWKGVACFRFMDWMHTNGSEIATWDERPKLDDASFSKKGIALELMIDLCNRQKADAWFCIPHLADDAYVRQFAKQVKAGLDPSLRVYVEFSNELWNGMFAQSRWAGKEGQKREFAEKPWEAGWRFTAYRSVQIFKIWEDVFDGTERLVRVLPTQAANPYVSERVVEFQDAYKHADALAVAPYVSFNVPAGEKELNADVVSKWKVDQVMDHLEKNALPQTIDNIRRQKEVADKYGLKLVAYEAGQHAVGVAGGENNQALTQLLHEANRHPRMAEIYKAYFEAWSQAGGDLLCYFSSVSRWSKWGSWGVLEYFDDDPESPKLKAVMEWARQCGQAVASP